jgi:diguanylate cyclase (GGDEF)-like protein
MAVYGGKVKCVDILTNERSALWCMQKRGGTAMKRTVSRKLITAMVSITIAASAVVAVVSSVSTYNLVMKMTEETLKNNIFDVSGELEEFYAAVNADLDELAARIRNHAAYSDTEQLAAINDIYSKSRFSKYMLMMYYGYADGKLLNTANWIPPADFSVRERVWYNLACVVPNQMVITAPYTNARTGKPCITFAHTVDVADGSRGVVAVDFSIAAFSSFIKMMHNNNDNIIIVTNEGEIIFHPEIELFVDKFGQYMNLKYRKAYNSIWEKITQSNGKLFRETKFAISNFSFSDKFYWSRQLQNNLYVLSFDDGFQLLTPLYTTICTSLIVMILSTALINFIMTFMIKNDIGVPLKILTDAVRHFNVMSMSFEHIEIKNDNEIRILADTLLAMERRINSMTEKAFTDTLTNLYNREFFNINFCSIFNDKYKDKVCAFFIIDLDFFKNVNDTYGHTTGDTVLKCVASILKEMFPDDGTHLQFCARLGGDEFAAVLYDTDKEAVTKKCEEIKEKFAHIKYVENKTGVSVSVGVYIAKTGGTSQQDMMAKADEALYKVKARGRDGYEVSAL